MEGKNEALEILERLKQELGGSHGLFSKKPDIALCGELCDRLSRILPAMLEEAEQISQKRMEILTNADVAAKNTIRAAEEKAAQLSNDTEVVRRAESDGKRIIENAYERCDDLVMRTKSHLDNMFLETEQFLLSTLSVVRTNREELRNAFTDDDN